MSAAQHTPGPWSVSKIDDRAAFNIFTPSQCSALLTLEPGKYNGADPRVSNVEADARLIAAAPELLEALQLCYDHCRLYHPEVEENNVGKTVRAAIAKATGSAS